MWQRDMLRGGREALGATVEANGGQKADECCVKRYFVGGKGVGLEIQKAWQGRRIQGSRRVRIWVRERWV